jgi:hypothetical protein
MSSSCPFTVRAVTGRCWRLKARHLLRHCLSFDQDHKAAIASNSFCALVLHPSTCVFFVSIYPYMPLLGRCWRPRCYAIYRCYCFATRNQQGNVPPTPAPCARYASSTSCLFFSPFTCGHAVRSMILETKTSCHLSLHCRFVRPGTSSGNVLPLLAPARTASSTLLFLPSISTVRRSSGRCANHGI